MIRSSEPPSRQAIIDFLNRQDGPVSLQALAEGMGVGGEEDIGLRRRLGAMQRDGQVLQNRKGGFMAVNRLDLIAGTGHDRLAAADYRQLARHGIRAARDGLRWHLIEASPGRYG